jgi:Protein of unknown function (DUF2924)
MDVTVLARVAALPKMTSPELRQLWRDLYQQEPPAANSASLARRLAYRLQELAYNIDPSIESRIAEHAREMFATPSRRKKKDKYARPIVGTVLVRQYRGVEYRVTVLKEGYEYQGGKYKSLSKIASLITGAAWSGPAFFGLKRAREVRH